MTPEKVPGAREKSRIPDFKSVEEEAEFWDKHDTTDYEDEFRTVKVRFSKKLYEELTIRLDKETLNQLRQEAHQKGISPATLARMWILEHLRGSSASS